VVLVDYGVTLALGRGSIVENFFQLRTLGGKGENRCRGKTGLKQSGFQKARPLHKIALGVRSSNCYFRWCMGRLWFETDRVRIHGAPPTLDAPPGAYDRGFKFLHRLGSRRVSRPWVACPRAIVAFRVEPPGRVTRMSGTGIPSPP
jgi:hypothetical protein